jgi:F-type H+-transporting ATPase subunit epsilon
MLTVELVSPDGILFEGEAEMVVARTVGGGDIAFLTGHVPFIGSLADAQVKVIQPGGREQLIAAHRGFVSVAEDRVSVLSDVAELAEDIDVGRAEASKAAAEEALRANADDAEAAAALRRAEVRLQVAQSRRA